MVSSDPPPADGPIEPADDDSAAQAVRRLIADAQAAAASETALVRLCAALTLQAVKAMSIWGAVAIMFAFVGLLALAIGATVLLAQSLGPWWAIGIVPGSLLLIALLSALRVRARLRGLQRAIATAWQ